MIVDFHANVGCGLHFNCDVDALIDDMDRNMVDKAVICPVEQFLAVENRQGNDIIYESVNKYPDRLIGFGTTSPWYGKKALEEIRRISDFGFKGIKLHPFYQGFLLNDEIIYPVIEECEKYGLVVLFHTGTPVCAMPFQLRDLALRYPKVNFVMGHMGWSDFWYDVVDAASGLGNIYLETSYQMPSVIFNCINNLPNNRILFGSDWPYSNIELEKSKIVRIQNRETAEVILGLNASRLLNIHS